MRLPFVLATFFCVLVGANCEFAAAQDIGAEQKDALNSLGRDIYLLAVEGDAAAQGMLGTLLRFNIGGEGNDPLEAANWFRKSADQGNATSQNALGEMYANGEGLSQDYSESIKWFRLAADQGYSDAQFTLGLMYFKGDGIPRNYNEAVALWQKSADQGHSGAQYNLGIMYVEGRGVIQDYLLAHMYSNLAASQGRENADHNRDAVALRMTSEQIAKAQQMAKEWIEKHK